MNHQKNKKLANAQRHAGEFPDDMISKILNRLPLNDAAKLCFISRSWLCAWKELPDLKFDAKFFAEVLKTETPTDDAFRNILSTILLSHVGFISKFYICIPKLNSSRAHDSSPWISFLSRNGVKEITIKNMQNAPLKLSYHLFSCLNLERLMLDNCILNLLPCFKALRNLKMIELERVTFMGNSLTDFIASCPVLHSLTLMRCKGFEYIDITAPNLKYFTVTGQFESICLRSAENLVSFSITLEVLVPNYQISKTCELLAYLAHPCRIEKVSFGGHFCEFLTAGGTGGMFPTCYRYLKSLQLSNIKSNDQVECVWVIGMIKSCPVLEDLKISFSSKECSKLKIKFDPLYQLSHLRKVHLTSVMGVTLELTLIELLLCCSPVLETMRIEKDWKITDALESKLTVELIGYRRASPRVMVVYTGPKY